MTPSDAAIEAAARASGFMEEDATSPELLLARGVAKMLRAAYAIDGADSDELRAALRANLGMAEYELSCAAEELDKPQEQWRWDELRRVRVALEYVRAALGPTP